MALNPEIKKDLRQKTCEFCHNTFNVSYFLHSNSKFSPDGYSSLCKICAKRILEKDKYHWNTVDKLCQYLNIPFVPKEFEKVRKMNPAGANFFDSYSMLFQQKEYQGLEWGQYYKEFKKLEEMGILEDELPILSDIKRRKLREKWGSNYDDEELNYLEQLYEGLLSTQNVNGALQGDQALKICKISLEIDSRIRSGEDFDKILASYDKLVKTAEFTPKNVKNQNDFDTFGEVMKWCEKNGFAAKYYDNVTRDVVDETLKNIQNYNRKLYVNESGIGDEINERIQALKNANELENMYNLNQLSDEESDFFDDAAYDELMGEDSFDAEVGNINV